MTDINNPKLSSDKSKQEFNQLLTKTKSKINDYFDELFTGKISYQPNIQWFHLNVFDSDRVFKFNQLNEITTLSIALTKLRSRLDKLPSNQMITLEDSEIELLYG